MRGDPFDWTYQEAKSRVDEAKEYLAHRTRHGRPLSETNVAAALAGAGSMPCNTPLEAQLVFTIRQLCVSHELMRKLVSPEKLELLAEHEFREFCEITLKFAAAGMGIPPELLDQESSNYSGFS